MAKERVLTMEADIERLDTGEKFPAILHVTTVLGHLKSAFHSLLSVKALAEDRDMTGTDFRVLLMFMANAPFANQSRITAPDIVRELGLPQPNVSRACSKLVRKGYLIERGKIGNVKLYDVAPELSWTGKIRHRDARLAREAQKIASMSVEGSA